MRCQTVAILVAIALAAGCGRGPIDEIAPASPDKIRQAQPVAVGEDDWPWWRGPSHNGIARGPAPLTTWSETENGNTENIVWKTPVPGVGHSSPIVVGEQIFLTTAEGGAQKLLAFDRATGRPLWTREIHQGRLPKKHLENTHASPTPASDGRLVFTSFLVDGAVWLTAVDLKGEIAWQTRVAAFESQHGYAPSPLIYKSLVIVAGDNQGQGFLAAVSRESGKIAWLRARDNEPSYGAPIVAHLAGRDQLLLAGQYKVTSYDPATGEEIWRCRGPAGVTANTIAFDEEKGLVFASGGYHGKGVMCIRADGAGDVTDTHTVWRDERIKAYVPSPLLVGDRLVVVNESPSVVSCLAAASGKVLWRRRISGRVRASPTLHGETIYLPTVAGNTFVFRAAPDYDLVAENKLAAGAYASPVICGGRIYLRTADALYAIGEK